MLTARQQPQGRTYPHPRRNIPQERVHDSAAKDKVGDSEEQLSLSVLLSAGGRRALTLIVLVESKLEKNPTDTNRATSVLRCLLPQLQ